MFSFIGTNPHDEGLKSRLQEKFYRILGHEGVRFTPERVSVTFNLDDELCDGFIVPKIFSNPEENLLDVFNKCLMRYNPIWFIRQIERDGFPFTNEDKEVLLSKLEYFKKMALENDPKKEIDLTNDVIRELDRLSWQVKERFIHAGEDYNNHWIAFIGDGASGLTQTLINLRSILK